MLEGFVQIQTTRGEIQMTRCGCKLDLEFLILQMKPGDSLTIRRDGCSMYGKVTQVTHYMPDELAKVQD